MVNYVSYLYGLFLFSVEEFKELKIIIMYYYILLCIIRVSLIIIMYYYYYVLSELLATQICSCFMFLY